MSQLSSHSYRQSAPTTWPQRKRTAAISSEACSRKGRKQTWQSCSGGSCSLLMRGKDSMKSAMVSCLTKPGSRPQAQAVMISVIVRRFQFRTRNGVIPSGESTPVGGAIGEDMFLSIAVRWLLRCQSPVPEYVDVWRMNSELKL